MWGTAGELLIVLGLILANGFFAAAEIAVIAARRSRLAQLAESGSRAAQTALDLASRPNRFLPTVQIGITLVATIAAVFGGARLEETLADRLSRVDLVKDYAHPLAFAVVVVGITFLSVLLGELVPKRIALLRADELATWVAGPMNLLSRAGRPVVWFMGVCTDGVLALLGQRSQGEQEVSLHDIEHLIETGAQSGLLEPAEQSAALGALKLGERTVRDIMRPRVDLDALDVDTPPEEVLGATAMAGMTRLPIYEGNLDHIVGFVNIKDILKRHYLGLPIELRKIMHPVLFVPETLPLDRLLVQFQERGSHLAVVLDEFGGTEGLVTLQDLLESIVGEIRDEHEQDRSQHVVRRDEASWLIDGAVSVDELVQILEIQPPADEGPRGYSTAAGLVLDVLGRIPSVGDTLVWQGALIEVVDMDGQRIDRLLVSKQQ
jgi:putative hemolysin